MAKKPCSMGIAISRQSPTKLSRVSQMMRLSDNNLRGRSVIAADGLAIGEISSVFIDAEAWRVESLQVTLHKDVADRLGADRSLFHAGMLELPIRMVQSVGDAVLLTVPLDELRQVLPTVADSV